MSSKRKGSAFSWAEKRAFYIGYGMGIGGRSIVEDSVQDMVLRQKSDALRDSMIAGLCTGEAHKKKTSFKKK